MNIRMVYCLSMLFFLMTSKASFSGLIIYEQTRTSNSRTGDLVFNQLQLQSHETLLKVEIDYLATTGLSLIGRNESSSSYTVTIDLLGLFRLRPPNFTISRNFSSQNFLFAPSWQIVSTSLGSFTYSGVSNVNSGGSGFAPYLGTGSFLVNVDWSTGVWTNRPSFNFAADYIGTVNTVTVRHHVFAVPEPSAFLLCILLPIAITLHRDARLNRPPV